MEQENVTQESIKRYPKKIIASFQIGNFIGLLSSYLYSVQLPFFYQSVVGLDITLYLIANLVYMFWNMFDDPLFGWLCDRSTRFTKRWGKRFPFIVMGAVPWCFMVIFIFFCPKITQIGQIGVFYWFMIFLCINDGFFSLYDINRVALFPDKFRDNKDRKIAGTITAFLETFGILSGVLIPVLVLSMLGNEIGWGVQAIVVSIVSVICVLLMIPGVREGPEMKQRRTKLDEKEKESFFAGMKFTLKDRNFMAYTSLYTFYTSCMGLVMASIPFFVQDILQLPTIGEMVLVFYVIAVLCTAPLWYMFSFKLGIKRVALIGAMILAFMGIPFFFVPVGPEGLGLTIIILIAAGCVDGAIISMTMPLFSSVVDKATVSSGRRREGMYQGTSTFFSRVGIAIQAIVFWIVRTFTGYHSGSTSTSELMGLRIQMSIFPMIIIGTGIIIFSLLYKIPSEELEANTKKLKELGL